MTTTDDIITLGRRHAHGPDQCDAVHAHGRNPRRESSSPLTIGLQDNNIITRFACVVPDEHRAPNCWGCVEKASVPLTPVLVDPSDDDDEDDYGDVCWFCLPHISPELNLLLDVFDAIEAYHQIQILEEACNRLGYTDNGRHVYATSDDMRVLTELVLLARRPGYWVSATSPQFVAEAKAKGYHIGRRDENGWTTWWDPCALCKSRGLPCWAIGVPNDPSDAFL